MIRSAFIPLLLTAFSFQQAVADPALIKEVEGLRNSLTLKDVSRKELTLRLADLYFDEGSEILKNPNPSVSEQQNLLKYRKRAITLYKEALSGSDGAFAPAEGTLQHKLKFQLARLYSDMEQPVLAKPLWNELVNQTELTHLRREAALRLAEYAEKVNTAASRTEADKFYRLAIDLCAGTDVCSYCHYRRAWLLREQRQLPASIDEMQIALWDSKGQIREEALRDLIVFLADEPGNGERGLLLVEALSRRISRPSLLNDLSEAFFSGGNKVAGTRVLEYVNNHSPHLKYQVRLMEEFYGLRNWDKFRDTLEQAKSFVGKVQLTKAEENETEKLLRRLTIQLDGERIGQPQYATDFKAAVMLYLVLFPTSKERFKMVEGWLAAENDSKLKMDQIQKWLAQTGLSEDEVTKLHSIRLGMAQKLKDYTIVAEEAGTLAGTSKEDAKARDYGFIRAAALYEMKAYETVLPIFQQLAQVSSPKVDVIGIRSQHLALDILGQSKNYSALIQQANLWLQNENLKNTSRLSAEVRKELVDMQNIVEQTEFEQAAAAGKTKVALETFKKYCLAQKFLPKSCENARVLAVQLKEQPTLLAVLKAEKKESDLAIEYEASGYFVPAAQILEKRLSAQNDVKNSLKVALLYELGDDMEARNRVINSLLARYRSKSPFGPEEDLIFQTLKDSRQLRTASLSLPWNAQNRARVADELELSGMGNTQTQKILLGTTQYAGLAWSKQVLATLKQLDREQSKIAFYGRKSSQKFERRIAALKKLVSVAERYLEGADLKTRVEIAGLLFQSHEGLAREIAQSPIPAEVDAQGAEQVKLSLAKLAEPFSEKAKAFEKLAREQLAKMPNVAERGLLETQIFPVTPVTPVTSSASGALASATPPAKQAGPFPRSALESLHVDPSEVSALSALKNFYDQKGETRLSSYFEGRLLQLQKEGAKP